MTRSNAGLSGAASAVAIVAVAIAGLASPATAGAIKKPGRHYAGSTNQQKRLAFELTADRNASGAITATWRLPLRRGGKSPTRWIARSG
jgi:hypothetical protein